MRLAVAGAFHTDFMSPAREKLQDEISSRVAALLAGTALSEPRIPVISNVDAAPHSDPEVIKAILAKQARDGPSVDVWASAIYYDQIFVHKRDSEPLLTEDYNPLFPLSTCS